MISSHRPPRLPQQVITGGRRLALLNMSARWISLFLLVLSFIMLMHGSVGGRTSGFKPDINSAIAQIIQDKNGDIFDCFNIERQPGSEGLQVQMEPSSLPDFVTHRQPSKSSSHIELPTLPCPLGTVPIRRTVEQKHEYSLTSYPRFEEHHSANSSPENNEEFTYYHAAYGTSKGTYYGGRASFTRFGVDDVKPNQTSGAFVWLSDSKRTQDHEVIAVGWLIHPQRYHDNKPRLTAYWRVNEKECYNTDCPGYVQLSSRITLGSVLPLARQAHLTITVAKDPQTHVWWLMIDDDLKIVGYWRAGLFSSLANSCAEVRTGGIVTSPPKIFSCKMGNGHFPVEGFDKCAAVTNILLVEEDNSFLIAPQLFQMRYIDRFECYNLGKPVEGGKDSGPDVSYGGLGGCTA